MCVDDVALALAVSCASLVQLAVLLVLVRPAGCCERVQEALAGWFVQKVVQHNLLLFCYAAAAAAEVVVVGGGWVYTRERERSVEKRVIVLSRLTGG